MNKNHIFRTNFLLTVISITIFLGISEFVLYVWDYQKTVSVKGYSVPHWWVRANPDWVGDFKRFLSAYEGDPTELEKKIGRNLSLLQEDRDLFWKLNGNLQIRAQNLSHPDYAEVLPDWLVRTDELGHRIGGDPTNPGDDRGFRVLFLGDSTTFGWGVDYEDSYPNRLRVRLEEVGVKIQILNSSMIGYSTHQGLTQLKKELQKIHPHFAVVSFGSNDAYFSSMTDENRKRINQNPFVRLRYALNRLRTF